MVITFKYNYYGSEYKKHIMAILYVYMHIKLYMSTIGCNKYNKL